MKCCDFTKSFDVELDKLLTALEKTEKKIKEADHSIYVAKEEATHINRNIMEKETAMKINEQNYGPKAAALVKETARYHYLSRLKFLFLVLLEHLQS